MKAFLDRNYRTTIVTLGELYDEDETWDFQTIEKPWKDNRKRISCIPTGTYIARLGMYYGGDGLGGKRDYASYEIMDVPDRTYIKIHIANYLHDIAGCVGLGMSRESRIPMVRQSIAAYESFMDYMDGIKEFELVIRDV